MSHLTKAERDKVAAADFGDPERRLFPILDQDDVDSAAHLIGKADNPDAVKRRIIAIAHRKGLRIPDAWKEATMSAHFSLPNTGRHVEGDYAIYPNALLFRAGDYPDKMFSLSQDEMEAAIRGFEPRHGNIEHTDFMRGRACTVRSIRLDDADPSTLRGEVAVPLWLDENLAEDEKKLSVEWDRATKRLSGLALTVNPRVSEAVLMSAYTAFAGKRHSQGDLADMQQVHDIAARQGAECAPGTAGMDYMPRFSTAPLPDAGAAKERTIQPMSRFQEFLAWMSGDAPREDGDTPAIDAPAAFASIAPLAPVAAAQPVKAEMSDEAKNEIERMRREIETLKAQRIAAEAAAFADRTITAGKALPAEREVIIAAFSDASLVDASGTVTFAEGRTTGMVERLSALYDARPSHELTREHVSTVEAGDASFALPTKTETPTAATPKPLTDKRRAELLSMTQVGKAAAKDKGIAVAN